MEPNRTSSFPAEIKKKGGLTRFDYQVLLGFAFMIFVMACASFWVYTERSAGYGIFLAACAAGESATMLVYYLNAKRRVKLTAGT